MSNLTNLNYQIKQQQENYNCIYFGKIKNILLLEEIINIWINLLNNNNLFINKLNDYENKILSLSNNKENSINNYKFILKEMLNNRKCIYYYNNYNNNDILNKCKNLIEKIIEYIFGIKKVYLFILKEDDLYYTIFNSEIYVNKNYKIISYCYNNNENICYKNFNINEEIIINNITSNFCSIKDIRKNISISLETGIKFNQYLYNDSIIVLLPEKIETFYFTAGEWTSILLHEIGHVFSYILFDINKLSNRINEKFADKFVSLYGYNGEFINSKRKELVMRIYLYYNKEIKKIKEQNEIRSMISIGDNKYNIHYEQFLKFTKHSYIYNRLISLLKQIKLENKNIYLSNEKRKEINKEIKNIKNMIWKYNNEVLEIIKDLSKIKNIDLKCKLYIKKQYFKIINDDIIDKLEYFNEKINKLDSRLFKSIINYIKFN